MTVITSITEYAGSLPSAAGPREENIPETALTVLHGFSPDALRARAAEHREKFEQDCRNEGRYLPSEAEMTRWFTV